MSHVDDGALHAYLDGACGERERSRIDEHLAGCADCRARLEDARALSGQVTGLLAELEPGGAVHAPPWAELEARAAARAKPPRRRAWVGPGLAWAASIALAFGVGWLSRPYWTQLPVELDAVAARQAEAPAAGPAGAAADHDATPGEGPTEPLAPAESPARTAEAERRGRSSVEAQRAEKAAPSEAEPAAREVKVRPIAVPSDAEADRAGRLAAAPVGETEGAAAFEESRAAAEREAPPPVALTDQLGPAAAANRALQAPVKAVGAADEAPAGRFVAVAPQDAALWLGAEPRTLTELELRRVEVGPGSAAAGGLSGRPALRLTYEDAAGQEIVLMQQWTGAPRDDAFAAEPVLTVLPTGRRLLRWSDDEGYRLILEGTLSGDSLRALAARLR